jgi:hypothetical protein
MRIKLIVLAALLAVFVGWASLPYQLPTSVALGPCGRDWTSPSSYLPRSSPTRSEVFAVGEVNAKICYGSPAAKEREIFGALVPWGELWRLGANEPTRLFVDGAIDLAGVELGPGRYSIYAIPHEERWQLFVSSSLFHWGNAITASVRDREVGSAELLVAPSVDHVEELELVWQADDAERGELVVRWQTTSVAIPISAGPTG